MYLTEPVQAQGLYKGPLLLPSKQILHIADIDVLYPSLNISSIFRI